MDAVENKHLNTGSTKTQSVNPARYDKIPGFQSSLEHQISNNNNLFGA